MYCIHCGQKLEDDETVCPACGVATDEPAVPAPPEKYPRPPRQDFFAPPVTPPQGYALPPDAGQSVYPPQTGHQVSPGTGAQSAYSQQAPQVPPNAGQAGSPQGQNDYGFRPAQNQYGFRPAQPGRPGLIGMTPRVFWLVFAYILSQVVSVVSQVFGIRLYVFINLMLALGIVTVAVLIFVFGLSDRQKGCSIAIPIAIFSITMFGLLVGIIEFIATV